MTELFKVIILLEHINIEKILYVLYPLFRKMHFCAKLGRFLQSYLKDAKNSAYLHTQLQDLN